MVMTPTIDDASDTGFTPDSPVIAVEDDVQVKAEMQSPHTPPRSRARKVLEAYPDSDDDTQQSSYAPSPLPRRKSNSKKSPKSSRPQSRKKASPPRKGEPRRQQNMVAQKKYRDKKVALTHLVRTIIRDRDGVDVQMFLYTTRICILLLQPVTVKAFKAQVKSLIDDFLVELKGSSKPLFSSMSI